MSFCPSCGKEYPEKLKQCPDCDEKLVEAFTEEHFDGSIMEVFASFSGAEAGLVKELLLDDGIFATLSNEMFGSLLTGVPSSAGEVKVLVSATDGERAKELIEMYVEDNPLNDPEDFVICDHCSAEVSENDRFCPFCGEKFDN